VSLAPFSCLIERHDDDIAVLWIDSHPDIDTNESDYGGHHAMIVSASTSAATRCSRICSRPRFP